MPRPRYNSTVDMTPDAKRRLMAFVGTLKDLYRVKFEPAGNTRSAKQNAYWHSCIVQPFFEFLHEQDPLAITDPDQAHIELKRQILGTSAVELNGVTCRIVPASRTMNTEEFSSLVDLARFWLADKVGIETVDPDPAYYTARKEKHASV